MLSYKYFFITLLLCELGTLNAKEIPSQQDTQTEENKRDASTLQENPAVASDFIAPITLKNDYKFPIKVTLQGYLSHPAGKYTDLTYWYAIGSFTTEAVVGKLKESATLTPAQQKEVDSKKDQYHPFDMLTYPILQPGQTIRIYMPQELKSPNIRVNSVQGAGFDRVEYLIQPRDSFSFNWLPSGPKISKVN